MVSNMFAVEVGSQNLELYHVRILCIRAIKWGGEKNLDASIVPLLLVEL